jgi:1,4-alpha-glucan branching enzyme
MGKYRHIPITNIILIIIMMFLMIPGCAPKSLEPVVLNEGVLFSYSAPKAKSVSIAGSFNRWDPEKDRLIGPDSNGLWTIVVPLPPGRYEYRFVVDRKEWVLDPSVPWVDDGFGDRNSLFIVPGNEK